MTTDILTNYVRTLVRWLIKKVLRGDKIRRFDKERDVKGFALKTHQRLCLWNPQAFEKA